MHIYAIYDEFSARHGAIFQVLYFRNCCIDLHDCVIHRLKAYYIHGLIRGKFISRSGAISTRVRLLTLLR